MNPCIYQATAPLLLGAVVLSSGCTKKPAFEKAIVYGTVSLAGKPIDEGKIFFHPIEGTPGGAMNASINGGKYEVQGKGGVAIGRHRIEIRGFKPGKPLENGEVGAAEQYVPDKYNRQSELIKEVPMGKERVELNFDLQ